MISATYLPEARDDIDAAYLHYERRGTGLGDQFVDELRKAIGRIEGSPLLYGEVFDDIRAAMLRRFPYIIYYQVKPGEYFSSSRCGGGAIQIGNNRGRINGWVSANAIFGRCRS